MSSKFILVGRISERINTSTALNGTPFSSFSVSVEGSYVEKKTGSLKTHIQYFNVVMFGENHCIVPSSMSIIDGDMQMRKNEKTGKYEISLLGKSIKQIQTNSEALTSNTNGIFESNINEDNVPFWFYFKYFLRFWSESTK